MEKIPPTIFLDIDGCLLKQGIPAAVQAINWMEPEVLPGVIEKLVEWELIGCKIIITTGRKPAYRKFTQWQLRKAGISYDKLIMGVGTGARILVNDQKPGYPTPKAVAYNLNRNEGLGSIQLP
jgi:hydroxymethylpyrimidine pyrophosphatase-like HAD family hydrolase